jgi:hypothetical protein
MGKNEYFLNEINKHSEYGLFPCITVSFHYSIQAHCEGNIYPKTQSYMTKF